MKVYSCLGASLLSAIAISASSSLAQLPLPIKPYQPPPTNRAPLVDIVTPSDGTMLLAPVNVHVCAVASYFTDTVASVEFFAGTNVLGVVTNSPGALSWGDVCRQPVAYFCLTWTNVPPGAYALTATAKDLAGKSVTSDLNSPGALSWGDVCRQPVAYFCLTWTNVPPGAYALTATAKDLAGKSVT